MMNEEDLNKKISSLEALLFIYGEPIEIKKIAEILEINENEAVLIVDEYGKKLKEGDRGLFLIRDGKKIQLATKPSFNKFLENFIKEEFTADLTPASLEALSIVAYAGPISRADLEYIRGVNSSFILRNLLMRGLVERSINPERANAYLYSPSFNLFKKLGISGSAEFPEFEKYGNLVKLLYKQATEAEKEIGKINNQNSQNENPTE